MQAEERKESIDRWKSGVSLNSERHKNKGSVKQKTLKIKRK